MNEQLENSENEFLWKLLANPADPSHSYIYNLQLVVNDHPQSGLLRALLVPKGDDQHLKHAAAYFTPGTLYKMATNLDSLRAVADSQIVYVEESTYVPRTYVNPMAEPFVPPVADDNESNFFHVEETDTPVAAEQVEPTVTPEAYLINEPELEKEEPVSLPKSEPVDDEVYEEIVPHNETPVSINPPAGDALAEEERDGQHTDSDETEEEAAVEYPWYINNKLEVGDDIAKQEPVEQSEYPGLISAPEGNLASGEAADEITEEDTEQPADENLLAKEYEEHLARINAANANVPFYTFEEEEKPLDKQDNEIDEEVYEEIISIEDIGLEQLAILNQADNNDVVTDNSLDVAGESGQIIDDDIQNDEEDTADAVEYRNDDYEYRKDDDFVISDEELKEVVASAHHEATATPVVTDTAVPAIAAPAGTDSPASEKLSRYNDDKMPYSFMWWLDKTRKEHADVYQPYTASTKNAKPPAARQEAPQPQNVKPVLADELQQQYFENIFNANSIDGLDPLPAQQPVAEQPVRKEDKIIERFIQEEPQIKHPSTVKLNSENKAKKSSEDRDELVTETLAKIYTEQMLYHKAINTYKKLMLKYPEKSLYFAGQIEQLEKKIN